MLRRKEEAEDIGSEDDTKADKKNKKEKRKRKKDKEKKKKKSEKKAKKKNKVKATSAAGSSSSSSSSDDDAVIAIPAPAAEAPSAAGGAPIQKDAPASAPAMAREAWMTEALTGVLRGRQTALAAVKESEEAAKQKEDDSRAEQIARRAMEGGLVGDERPVEEREKDAAPIVGDGGAAWRRKALLRARQRAEEEGLDVSDIVTHQLGGWDEVKKKEAEVAKQIQEQREQAREERRHSHRDEAGRRPARRSGWRKSRSKSRSGSNPRSRGPRHRSRSRSRGRDNNNNRKKGDEERDEYGRRVGARSAANVDEFGRDERGDEEGGGIEMPSQRARFGDKTRDRDDKDKDRDRDSNKEIDRDDERDRERGDGGGGDRGRNYGAERQKMEDEEDIERGKIKAERAERLKRWSSNFPKSSSDIGAEFKNKFGHSESASPSQTGGGSGSGNGAKGSAGSGAGSSAGRARAETEEEKKDREERNQFLYGTSRRRETAPSSSSSPTSSSSSSSSSSSAAAPATSAAPTTDIETETDVNALAARAIRAKLTKNHDLLTRINARIAELRGDGGGDGASTTTAESVAALKASSRAQVEVLSELDSKGRLRKLDPSIVGRAARAQEEAMEQAAGKRGKHKNMIGKDGQRTSYFDSGDDEKKKDLMTLLHEERMAEDLDMNYADSIARNAGFRNMSLDEQFDSMDHTTKVYQARVDKKITAKREEFARRQHIAQHKSYEAALATCFHCINSTKFVKHLVVSIGLKMYLSLPAVRRVNEDHCLIIPIDHVAASTGFDENVYDELEYFRKHLVRMYAKQKKGVIFMETCTNIGQQRHHAVIECIALPLALFQEAPMYFKKGLLETDSEWSQNHKLIDTREKGLRRSIPSNFPYFSVQFGVGGGYAHVIEETAKFPLHFGLEIVLGMIEEPFQFVLRQKRQSLIEERERVDTFLRHWSPFDWTKRLKDQSQPQNGDLPTVDEPANTD